MRMICTICARGGSKGVPRKNVRQLNGIPLLAHTLRHAIAADCFDAIAVSSDDQEILQVAHSHGATILVERPKELAQDDSGKLPAIRHCVEAVEALTGKIDIVVDLDATSPLRNTEDVIDAIRMLTESQCDNVVTATESRRSPYFNMIEKSSDGSPRIVKPLDGSIVRRQDAPATFDMNASIYVWRRDSLFSQDRIVHAGTRMLMMPPERSHDIDSELDFDIVEFLLSRREPR